MRRFRQEETHLDDSLSVLGTARDEFRLEVERQAARLLEAAESRARQVEREAATKSEQTKLQAERELQMLSEKRAALFSHMIKSVDKLERDFTSAIGNFRRELEGVALRSEGTAPHRATQPSTPKPRLT